jgi:hypothetical protein
MFTQQCYTNESLHKEEHYYYLKEGEKRKKLYKKFLIFSCFPPIFFFFKKNKWIIILPWKQRNEKNKKSFLKIVVKIGRTWTSISRVSTVAGSRPGRSCFGRPWSCTGIGSVIVTAIPLLIVDWLAFPLWFPRVVQLRPEVIVVGVVIVIVAAAAAAVSPIWLVNSADWCRSRERLHAGNM